MRLITFLLTTFDWEFFFLPVLGSLYIRYFFISKNGENENKYELRRMITTRLQ
jgi:hypothetical protein